MFMVMRRGIAFCREAHVLYLDFTAYEENEPVPVKVDRVTRKGRLSCNLDCTELEIAWRAK